MHLRSPLATLALTAALLCTTPACLETNNSPAPADMSATDMSPSDQGADMPPTADMDMGGDQGADLGACNGGCPAGKVCDPTDDQCVTCTDNTHCAGNTPHCKPATRTCVGCLTKDDCNGGTCDPTTNTCVGCLTTADCSGSSVCDTATKTCVACLTDTDCTTPTAARCDTTTNTCTGCTTNDHCARFTDTNTCNANTCVQCTPATEDTDCIKNVNGEDKVFSCNPNTFACTDVEKQSRSRGESCMTDSQCIAGFFCVPMEFQGQPRAGGYCLRPISAGCQAPFRTATPTRTSLSGHMDKYCGVAESLTTCEAVNAFVNSTSCAGDTSVCGEGGLCKNLEVVGQVCTIPCSDELQCTDSRTCGLDGFCGTGA